MVIDDQALECSFIQIIKGIIVINAAIKIEAIIAMGNKIFCERVYINTIKNKIENKANVGINKDFLPFFKFLFKISFSVASIGPLQ